MRWENVWERRVLAGSSGRRAPACPRRGNRKGGLRWLLLSRRRALRATPPRLPRLRLRTQRSFRPALQRACRPRPVKDTFPGATAFRFVAPRVRRLRRCPLVKRFGRRRRKALGQRKRRHASQLLPSVGPSGELVRSVAPPWRTTPRLVPSAERTSMSLAARKRVLGLAKQDRSRVCALKQQQRERPLPRRRAPSVTQLSRHTALRARRRGQAAPRRRQHLVFRLMVRVRARERP